MIEHALSPLILKNKTLLPIVQGGMGIGVSAHRLAGTVAGLGGVGTVASVGLRHPHPDLVEESLKFTDEAEYDRLNLIALDREVKAALKLANGNGMVSVNVMKAVASHADYVRQACESGAQVVTMGAGLPLDLPEMVANFPDVALLPILSEARGIAIVIKRWMKKNRLPDAIVIEHPKYAGGHLGAAKKEDINDDRFNFDRVLEETFALFKTLDLEREQIPLIVAGGVNSHEKVKTYLGWGAAAVQVGTPFAVCQEGDAGIQKSAGRSQVRSHCRIFVRGRCASTRRTHPLPQKLPAPRNNPPSQRQARPPPLHPSPQLLGRVWAARRLAQGGAVLYRPQLGRRVSGRPPQRAVLPWLGKRTVWGGNPQCARSR